MRERLPLSWRLARALLQSNSEPLDVVCHFLWAGLATAWRFEECGKNQCEREERKCVFISVGGAWFPLWSVCRPAPGPPYGQQKPWGHFIRQDLAWCTCLDKKNSCIQWNSSRCSQNHAAWRLADLCYTVNDWQVIPKHTYTRYFVVQCHDNLPLHPN